MGLNIAPRNKWPRNHMPQSFIPTGSRSSVTEGLPVVKLSGQGAEQMRNRSSPPGIKDRNCIPLPQVDAALSLALTGNHSCVADHPKLSS